MKLRYPFLELSTVNAPFLNEIKERVNRVIESGRYIGGEEVASFEKSLAAMAGTDFAVGVSNGLDALRLIFKGYIAMGVLKPGDEVILPANTYIASTLAVSDAGLVAVPAEPSPETSNLDMSRLEEYLTPRTRAVMPVHLYGRACWSEELELFAQRHNLKIIEDNAQAIGASIITPSRGHRHTGGLGNAAAFSFYPTKNIGAMGDAGAVTTSDPELARIVRALANYGSDRRYHNILKGYNCRLDPMQAAILNLKLPYTEKENQLRREIAQIYLSQIHNSKIGLPKASQNPEEMVWHQFVIHTTDRKRFTDYLTDNSVGWDIHYATPPHRQPCYTELADKKYPITDRLADTCVSLPITRCTSLTDAEEIAAIINAY